VGLLLVTALLVVPGAAARNLAKSAAGLFWWASVQALIASILGLYLPLSGISHRSDGYFGLRRFFRRELFLRGLKGAK